MGCQFVFLFFPDRAAGLSEMYRVLQVSGTIVIDTWHYSDNLAILDGFSVYLELTDTAAERAEMVGAMAALVNRMYSNKNLPPLAIKIYLCKRSRKCLLSPTTRVHTRRMPRTLR